MELRVPDKDGITLHNARVVVKGIGVVSRPQITFVCCFPHGVVRVGGR